MDIYYINSDEFLKKYDTNFLRQYVDGQEFKSLKRFIQHSIGRYIVKTVGENIYGIKNPKIIIENEKPKFQNSDINFSITHCGKYIAVAFDTNECGLDIEEIKPRELEPLSKRYGKDFSTLEDFYIFWTKYEAEIKLQKTAKWSHSEIFQNNYVLTAVTSATNADFSINKL